MKHNKNDNTLRPPLASFAERGGITSYLMLFTLCCTACTTTTSTTSWPPTTSGTADQPQLTVVIALSSVVPGGIIGHAGIAIDDTYWDYGPTRTDRLQPIKSLRSSAGPWWDDPDQQWAIDRSLSEVFDDMPKKVHPVGSLVAVIQCDITHKQANTITAFWQDAYDRMHRGDDTYRLTARQCSSMVGWSLQRALIDDTEASERLPRDLHLVTPTKLYAALRDRLEHTAGPRQGQRADVTVWQLGREGFSPWQRPGLYDRLAIPELPRTRLAFERVKHLPIDLLHHSPE